MRPRALIDGLSIRAKLTLAYTGAIAVTLAAIGALLYLNFHAGLDDGLNATLRARADDVAALLGQQGASGLARHPELLGGSDLAAQVLRADGTVAVAPAREHAPLLSRAEVREAARSTSFVDRGEQRRLLVRRLAGGRVLVVEASLAQREHAAELAKRTLLVGGMLTLLVAALAGYGLARAVVRPMEAMRRAASRISDLDPHARLPLPVADDEVHRLGVTLNDMLARLERARERERAFVSDASHELRAPLAILKTEVEVALRTPNPPETLRAALATVGEEADRLAQLADDLLLVAQSDAGQLALDRRPLDVQALLEDTARRFRTRAREQRRSLTVEAGADVALRADAPRIEQALSNLVENALRHGDGAVTLRSRHVDGTVELHVLDEGAGVPAEFIPQAFERFSQLDRARSGPGAGLGLAIVGLIANAHDGEAGLRNRGDRRGADAWLRLPLA
ncbi:MAG: HAMP domain-containing protein [Actinobacteria bacterium]|nr:HAMP domain-containing protein [Actinomycetota bacterium]